MTNILLVIFFWTKISFFSILIGERRKKMIDLKIPDCIQESEKLIFEESSKYQSIMNVPTLNHIELYNKMQGSWNSYLGVLGSFGPSLEAILKGSNKVVTFDINPLNILHAYLIIAAILSLEYEEFMNFIFYSAELSYYSKYYFDRIKEELPEEVKTYWQHMITTYENHPNFILLFYNKHIFYEDLGEKLKEILVRRNHYLEKESFYLLKKKLKKVKIKLLHENFNNILDTLKGQKFDKIYLSCLNLYLDERYYDIVKKYISLLNPTGIMQAAYIYNRYLKDEIDYNRYYATELSMKEVVIGNSNEYENDVAFLYRKREK